MGWPDAYGKASWLDTAGPDGRRRDLLRQAASGLPRARGLLSAMDNLRTRDGRPDQAQPSYARPGAHGLAFRQTLRQRALVTGRQE
jgi:hypothetical protein